jgi:hypothetical protein
LKSSVRPLASATSWKSYSPLMADSAEMFGRFDDEQLKVVIEFIKLERDLLSRHTGRVGDMLAARRSAAAARR